jgi:hypothetical protein
MEFLPGDVVRFADNRYGDARTCRVWRVKADGTIVVVVQDIAPTFVECDRYDIEHVR